LAETELQPTPAAPEGGEQAGAAPAARKPAERPAGNARPRAKREYRGRYAPRRKVCAFCAEKIAVIDYKDAARLRRYLSERAKIEPRRKTGTCAAHQRALATAIKRARHVALLPFTAEHMRITGMVPR
jgi:small subunit ribosomal protein S18